MSAAAKRLELKYGLDRTPTRSQLLQFHTRAKELLSLGKTSNEAGHQAAKEIFPDYRTRFYKSQADTLEMLLRLIESE